MIRSHPRSSAMPPFDRARMISSSLIETMRLSCTVFEIQQVICQNSPTSTYPHLHLAPPFEFRKDFWRRKTRAPGLSCGVVCVILRLALLVEHRLVTDTQTQTDRQRDRQTDSIGHGLYRSQYSSRGEKCYCVSHVNFAVRGPGLL